jgi:prephenate dehydrogenase
MADLEPAINDAPPAGRALVVGVGLIGGSIALALKRTGWSVVGRDRSSSSLEMAMELGVIDGVAPDGYVAGIACKSMLSEHCEYRSML